MGRVRWSRMLLAVVVALHVVVAFLPFRFDPPRLHANGLDRLPGGDLRLGRFSVARTVGPPPWLPDAIRESALTVALEVRPHDRVQSGPARILTVSRDYEHTNLTVAQEGADLVVRLRRVATGEDGVPPFRVPGAFRSPGWRHIEVRIHGERFETIVDGRTRVRAALRPDALRSWDETYRLALGDELIGGRSWSGDIRRAEVRVGGTLVDYTAPGALDGPAFGFYVPERLRDTARMVTPTGLLDSVAHVLGFVPVGALLVRSRREPSLAGLVPAALAVAASIEVGQIAVVGRHPSLVDVALHLAGALLGGVLVMGAPVRRPPSRRERRRVG